MHADTHTHTHTIIQHGAERSKQSVICRPRLKTESDAFSSAVWSLKFKYTESYTHIKTLTHFILKYMIKFTINNNSIWTNRAGKLYILRKDMQFCVIQTIFLAESLTFWAERQKGNVARPFSSTEDHHSNWKLWLKSPIAISAKIIATWFFCMYFLSTHFLRVARSRPRPRLAMYLDSSVSGSHIAFRCW